MHKWIKDVIQYLLILSLQTDEERYAASLNSKIHEKHPNIPENLTIPVVFIDPVLQIFKDPCDSKTIPISDREKEMFDNYTSRFVKFYGHQDKEFQIALTFISI